MVEFDFLEWLRFVARIEADTIESGAAKLAQKLDELEKGYFSKKELSALYRILEKHYIDYQDEEAMDVVKRISELACM